MALDELQNDIIVGYDCFTVQVVDRWGTAYRASINGHFVEIVKIKHGGVTFNMKVDGQYVFNALRECEAKQQILETLKGL